MRKKNSLNKKLEGVRNSKKYTVGTFWFVRILELWAIGSYLKLKVCHCNLVETGKNSGMKRNIPNLHTLFSILNKRERIGTECQQGVMAGWGLLVSIIHEQYVCTPDIGYSPAHQVFLEWDHLNIEGTWSSRKRSCP